jgi:hypothetical protein
MNKKLIWSFLNSGGSSFTAEYTAILARGTALGYTLPSAAQQVKQNALIVALKAAGAWSLLDVLYVWANDSSLNFGRINWINPSVLTASLTLTPSFTSNKGFGRSSSSVVDTGFIPNTHGVNYTLNSSFIHIGMADAITPAGNDLLNAGTTAPITKVSLFPSGTDFCQYGINDAATSNVSLGSLGTQKAGQYFSIRTASNVRFARTPDGNTATTSQVSTALGASSLKTYSTGSDTTMRNSFISAGSGTMNFSAYETCLNNYYAGL